VIKRETKPARAYEIMAQVLVYGDAVELARLLSCSPELVRAWCRPPATESEFTATGKFGPLDRLRTLIAMIKDDDGNAERAYPVGQYIASLLGGVFVPTPAPKSSDDELIQRISTVMRETAEAIELTRASWFDESPGKITKKQYAICTSEIDEAIVSLVQLRRWIDGHTSMR